MPLMKPDRFEDIDKAALVRALVNLMTCPVCRRELRPAQIPGHVGCVTCDKVWRIE